MTAVDRNSGRSGAREVARRREEEESMSRDANSLNAEDQAQGSLSGGVDRGIRPEAGYPRAYSVTPPPSNVDDGVDIGSDRDFDGQTEGKGEDSAEEFDAMEDEPMDASDTASDPETESSWMADAQLSSLGSVPEGMGTIALERIPLEERTARQAGSGLAAQLADSMGQMTDAQIMQRAGAGDEACLEFLIAKYRRPIISFLYRMVHNQAVAEELAQEVFLRVYRARTTYRAEARFSTWLYRIASNMAINHARDTKFERATSSLLLDQVDEETGTRPDVADARPIAEQGMLQDERTRRIREHVMALPERQRLAVVMHKYQDMDYRQIGAVLKLSESATKSLLFRAYQTLRERLKEFA